MMKWVVGRFRPPPGITWEKRGMDMRITDLSFMQGYIRMATDGANMGWHERNGGNLTYRLTAEEAEAAAPYMTFDKPWEDIGVAVPNLGGAFFLATGSGKFLRNVCLAPQDNLCIAQLNEAGTQYRIVWGLEQGGRPTSEFPSHLMNHSVKFDVTGGKHRAHTNVDGFTAADCYQNFMLGVIGQLIFPLHESGNLLPQLKHAPVAGVAGIALFQRSDTGFADMPRGGKIRFADAQGNHMLHAGGNIEEFSDAGGLQFYYRFV